MSHLITVNGKPRPLPSGLKITDLVAEFTGHQSPQGVAVAINGSVVRRKAWPSTPVHADDDIEILQAVSGG